MKKLTILKRKNNYTLAEVMEYDKLIEEEKEAAAEKLKKKLREHREMLRKLDERYGS